MTIPCAAAPFNDGSLRWPETAEPEGPSVPCGGISAGAARTNLKHDAGAGCSGGSATAFRSRPMQRHQAWF